MSYQTIIRNSRNELIKSQHVGMKFSILKGSPTGFVVYSETKMHPTNINEFGKDSTIVTSYTNGISNSIGRTMVLQCR
ncbi:hypothetical protein [Epilithonimonas sp.]|uniref:hypothetical protein n=1 Tax=Epilithonimonas sp. TaxID=2894511 RepID=UPI0028AF9796|nr:hypothetical protein [Epilithonimonas sp.]